MKTENQQSPIVMFKHVFKFGFMANLAFNLVVDCVMVRQLFVGELVAILTTIIVILIAVYAYLDTEQSLAMQQLDRMQASIHYPSSYDFMARMADNEASVAKRKNNQNIHYTV